MAKKRVFNIMQYEYHPKTGEPLLSEEQIKKALDHKSFKEWAYICHDEDVYSEKDEIQFGYKQGDKKPKHWHIVCRSERTIDVEIVADWFGIKSNFIDLPKGRGAFIDCIEYLTHMSPVQQALGKHLYDSSEVIANFDWEERIAERIQNISKYGADLDKKTQIRYRVLFHGLTMRELIEEDKFAYLSDYKELEKLRLKYIEHQTPPETRVNYYICGKGGVGKGLMSRAIARNLYPQYTKDDDIFFEVGAKGAPFEGYDGQPVIIWNDRRSIDLLTELGGRGNVFNVFDTHPTHQRQNIKYSSINLCNEVNIVNSVEPYIDFLDGLSGTYKDKNGMEHHAEDKNQGYRRFPIIIPLHLNDFDMLINKGYLGSGSYNEYYEHKNIVGNLQRVREICTRNEKLALEMEQKLVLPVIEKHQEILEKDNNKEYTEDEIRELFKDYGKQRITKSEYLAAQEQLNNVVVIDESGNELTEEEFEQLKLLWDNNKK